MASGKSLLAVLAFTLAACSPPEDKWQKTRPVATFPPVIVEQEKFPTGCPFRALGCYIPEDLASATPAIIYLKPKLPPWEYECVMKHEMKHHAGWTHAPGLSDCG